MPWFAADHNPTPTERARTRAHIEEALAEREYLYCSLEYAQEHGGQVPNLWEQLTDDEKEPWLAIGRADFRKLDFED